MQRPSAKDEQCKHCKPTMTHRHTSSRVGQESHRDQVDNPLQSHDRSCGHATMPSTPPPSVPCRPMASSRRLRRGEFKAPYIFRIVQALLLIGTVFIVVSFSRYMETALPRELLLSAVDASFPSGRSGTPMLRTRQRTFPRIVMCLVRDSKTSTEATESGSLAETSYRTERNNSYRCQPYFRSVAALASTGYLQPPEDRLYPLKPQRTSPDLASEPDATRFYADANLSSDELPGLERRVFPLHETDPHCVPLDSTWQSGMYPVCNDMHAYSLRESLLQSSGDGSGAAQFQLLSSKGFWRHAWKQILVLAEHPGSPTATVWKTLKIEHNFEEAYYENSRVDALAMERLTASRNVIDIYSFCGTSVVTEYAGKELTSVVNRLTSFERLQMARQVAKGVADIHGITRQRPSLVHNDINLANLVITHDNRPVLNDFNIAILLMKHNETNETCPFVSHFPNPQWRAPEEQVAGEEESQTNPPLVTEKIDIYALGNVFYRLAVGSSPWKQSNAHKVTRQQKTIIAALKRNKGALPPVPECIQKYDDPAMQVLLEAMRWAYRFQPETRPSAAELVDFLTDSIKEIRSMNLTDRVPLWDGETTQKRKISPSSGGNSGEAFNITIGNAYCGMVQAGESTSSENL